MTKNRVTRLEARELRTATGLAYTEVVRLKAAFDEVLAAYPALTDHGFGVYRSRRMSAAEQEQAFAESRETLLGAAATVIQVHLWLRSNIRPIKTPTQSSYAVKHIVERARGDYVSNGELITAALLAGFPMGSPQGPNALLGMSKRDLDTVGARTE